MEGTGGDGHLVDISKRSLTELTLHPVAPTLSSSCSQSNELSNQFMSGSRRRLLRNCFISGEREPKVNKVYEAASIIPKHNYYQV